MTPPSPPQSAEGAYKAMHDAFHDYSLAPPEESESRYHVVIAALDACIRAVKEECIEWVKAEAQDCGCSERIEHNIRSQVKP
jgi:hypothetical protein